MKSSLFSSSRFIMVADERTPLSGAGIHAQGEISPLVEGTLKRAFSFPAEGEGSSTSFMFNILLSLMGTGVLALPFAIANAGLVAGVLTMVFVGLVCMTCGYIMVFCLDVIRGKSYQDLAATFLGPKGDTLVMVVSLLTLLGVVAVNMLVITDNLTPLFSGFMTKNTLSAIVAALCFVISLNRSMHASRHLSVFGFACLLFMLIIFVDKAFNRPASVEETHRQLVGSVESIIFAVPVFSFSFGCSIPLCITHGQMRNRKDTYPTLPVVYGITFLFYICICFAAIVCYNGMPAGNVLLGFGAKDVLANACRVLLALVVLLKTPILMLPLRELFLTCVLNLPRHHRLGAVPHALLTGSLILLLALVARGCPGLHVLTALLGATCCSMFTVVWPGMFLYNVSYYPIEELARGRGPLAPKPAVGVGVHELSLTGPQYREAVSPAVMRRMGVVIVAYGVVSSVVSIGVTASQYF